MCGGTSIVSRRSSTACGLSPRVRGNRMYFRREWCEVGSIPACAGEPASRGIRKSAARVYPRVCGGTSPSSRAPRSARGLSPRVRGNPARRYPPLRTWRSIPACAGEPDFRESLSPPSRVYPRVCGGTQMEGKTPLSKGGLSPRVRGNLGKDVWQTDETGSIPACAGEPSASRASRWPTAVYPRVCGGTTQGTAVPPLP